MPANDPSVSFDPVIDGVVEPDERLDRRRRARESCAQLLPSRRPAVLSKEIHILVKSVDGLAGGTANDLAQHIRRTRNFERLIGSNRPAQLIQKPRERHQVVLESLIVSFARAYTDRPSLVGERTQHRSLTFLDLVA
jgi:hypothetical protein